MINEWEENVILSLLSPLPSRASITDLNSLVDTLHLPFFPFYLSLSLFRSFANHVYLVSASDRRS